jgi:hypothetical protein
VGKAKRAHHPDNGCRNAVGTSLTLLCPPYAPFTLLADGGSYALFFTSLTLEKVMPSARSLV